jgi:hypothetical protein
LSNHTFTWFPDFKKFRTQSFSTINHNFATLGWSLIWLCECADAHCGNDCPGYGHGKNRDQSTIRRRLSGRFNLQ